MNLQNDFYAVVLKCVFTSGTGSDENENDILCLQTRT